MRKNPEVLPCNWMKPGGTSGAGVEPEGVNSQQILKGGALEHGKLLVETGVIRYHLAAIPARKIGPRRGPEKRAQRSTPLLAGETHDGVEAVGRRVMGVPGRGASRVFQFTDAASRAASGTAERDGGDYPRCRGGKCGPVTDL